MPARGSAASRGRARAVKIQEGGGAALNSRAGGKEDKRQDAVSERRGANGAREYTTFRGGPAEQHMGDGGYDLALASPLSTLNGIGPVPGAVERERN